MNLEIGILSEISKTEKENYRMTTLMWTLKGNDRNELTKQKQTHRLRKNELWFLGRKMGGRDS